MDDLRTKIQIEKSKHKNLKFNIDKKYLKHIISVCKSKPIVFNIMETENERFYNYDIFAQVIKQQAPANHSSQIENKIKLYSTIGKNSIFKTGMIDSLKQSLASLKIFFNDFNEIIFLNRNSETNQNKLKMIMHTKFPDLKLSNMASKVFAKNPNFTLNTCIQEFEKIQYCQSDQKSEKTPYIFVKNQGLEPQDILSQMQKMNRIKFIPGAKDKILEQASPRKTRVLRWRKKSQRKRKISPKKIQKSKLRIKPNHSSSLAIYDSRLLSNRLKKAKRTPKDYQLKYSKTGCLIIFLKTKFI